MALAEENRDREEAYRWIIEYRYRKYALGGTGSLVALVALVGSVLGVVVDTRAAAVGAVMIVVSAQFRGADRHILRTHGDKRSAGKRGGHKA